jgi:hypothetical protein
LWKQFANDPEWKNGDYQQQPHGYSRIAPLVAIMTGNPVRQFETYSTPAAADAWYQRLTASASQADVNDALYWYDASSDYNPSPDLERSRPSCLPSSSRTTRSMARSLRRWLAKRRELRMADT